MTMDPGLGTAVGYGFCLLISIVLVRRIVNHYNRLEELHHVDRPPAFRLLTTKDTVPIALRFAATHPVLSTA